MQPHSLEMARYGPAYTYTCFKVKWDASQQMFFFSITHPGDAEHYHHYGEKGFHAHLPAACS